MKKYSSTTRVSSRRSTINIWKRGALITAAILLAGWLFPYALATTSYVVLYPVEQVINWYSYSEQTLPAYLRSRTELADRITLLEQELANRASTQATVQRLINENMQLRAVAELGTANSRIAARVIAQPTLLSYDLLKIDQGSEAGVMVGAPVYVGVDTVVGVVIHVAPTYAFVDLVTTPDFSATAYVVGPNIFAPLEGVGGGVARVRVPQGVSLSVGNLVLLPSVDSGVYGEIVAVENVPTQPEQFGYVTPPVPLQSMLYVSVGREPGQERAETEIDEAVRTAVRHYFRLSTVPVITASTTEGTTTSSGTSSNIQ